MGYKNAELKDADIFEDAGDGSPVRILFTAGAEGLDGGAGRRTGGFPARNKQSHNPFKQPVRGYPGAKGQRCSRVSGRMGGNGLIRKYGILMKRQEFREKAEEIGFVK